MLGASKRSFDCLSIIGVENHGIWVIIASRIFEADSPWLISRAWHWDRLLRYDLKKVWTLLLAPTPWTLRPLIVRKKTVRLAICS